MKIIQLTTHFHPYLGGVEEHVYNISKRLSALGYEILVYTTREIGSQSEETRKDINVKRFFPIRIPLVPYGMATLGVGMLKSCIHEGADIVHAHGYGFSTTYVGLLSGFVKRVPYVVTPHSNPYSRIYPLRDATRAIPLTRAGAVIALTDSEKMRLVRAGAKQERIHIIPNGVDAEEVARAYEESSSGSAAQEDFILHVGRLDIRDKGQDVLVKALSLLKKDFPRLKLIMVGDGPDRERLQTLSRRLNVNSSFILRLPRIRLLALMKKSRLLVVPSRQEAFPLVLLEAMSMGAPIVASNVGAIPEIVGDCGLLVRPNDANELSKAICRALQDADWRSRASSFGPQLAKRFSWDDVVRRLDRLYRSLAR